MCGETTTSEKVEEIEKVKETKKKEEKKLVKEEGEDKEEAIHLGIIMFTLLTELFVGKWRILWRRRKRQRWKGERSGEQGPRSTFGYTKMALDKGLIFLRSYKSIQEIILINLSV